MGKPEDLENFREIRVKGLSIYVEKNLLKDTETHKKGFRFVLEGYGWFRIPPKYLNVDTGDK